MKAEGGEDGLSDSHVGGSLGLDKNVTPEHTEKHGSDRRESVPFPCFSIREIRGEVLFWC